MVKHHVVSFFKKRAPNKSNKVKEMIQDLERHVVEEGLCVPYDSKIGFCCVFMLIITDNEYVLVVHTMEISFEASYV